MNLLPSIESDILEACKLVAPRRALFFPRIRGSLLASLPSSSAQRCHCFGAAGWAVCRASDNLCNSKVRDIWAPGGDRCRWVSNVVLVVCVSASLTILQPPLLISLFLRHAVLIDEPPAVELGGLGVSVPTWHTHVSRFDAPRPCTRAYAPIRQCFIPFHAPRPARAPCTGS